MYKGTASLDRIDSTKGYVRGNIQWVHKDINWFKRDYPKISFWHSVNLLPTTILPKITLDFLYRIGKL